MLNTKAKDNQHNYYYSESKRIKIKDDLMDMSSSSSNNIPIQPGNLKYILDLTRWGHIYEVFGRNNNKSAFKVEHGTEDQVRKAFIRYDNYIAKLDKKSEPESVSNFLMDFVLYIDQKGSIKGEEDTISDWMKEYEEVGKFSDKVKRAFGIPTTSTYNDDNEDTNDNDHNDVSIGSNSKRLQPKTREEEAYDLAFAQAKRIEENVKWIDAEIKKTEDKLEKATSNYNEFIQEYTSLPSFVKNSWKTIEEYYDHFKTKNTNLKTELKEAENKLEKAIERLDKANATSASSSIAPSIPLITNLPSNFEELKMLWKDIPFTLACSEFNMEKQAELLGKMNNPAYKWPIVNGKLDMKFYRSHDAQGFTRPAAQKLYDFILKHPEGDSCFLIAASGTGKTSTLFEVGHFHYLLYIQCETLYSRRGSREEDKGFRKFVEDISQNNLLRVGDVNSLDVNWIYAKNRAQLEFLVRLCLLARLREELEKDENKQIYGEINPWKYLVQQMNKGANEDFCKEMIKKLYDFLKNPNAMEDLFKKLKDSFNDLLSNGKCHLVVAIDEVQLGANVLAEQIFKVDKKTKNKGVLFPMAAAAYDLCAALKWSMIFTGTGTTQRQYETLKSDIGKSETPFEKLTQNDFPMAERQQVESILQRLSFGNMLQSGSADKSLDAFIGSFLLESIGKIDNFEQLPPSEDNYVLLKTKYLYDARFRITCTSIELIPQFVKNQPDMSPLDIIYYAMCESVKLHKNRLLALLADRVVTLNSDPEKRGKYISLLHQIYVAECVIGGNAWIGTLEVFPEIDLVTLGLAAYVQVKGTLEQNISAYKCNEAFVLETIEELFEQPNMVDLAERQLFKESLNHLEHILTEAGQQCSIKGYFIERMVAWALISLKKNGSENVASIPFVREKIKNDPMKQEYWKNVPLPDFIFSPFANGREGLSTFLKSTMSVGKIVIPENACRPDAITMLRVEDDQKNAIVLGCACYTDIVDKDKVKEQIRSTDMSRAYLKANADEVYAQVESRREDWVKADLHKTVALRLHICLPRISDGTRQLYNTKLQRIGMVLPQNDSMNGSANGNASSNAQDDIKSNTNKDVSDKFEIVNGLQDDMIFHFDMNNIHELFASIPDESRIRFFKLLAYATRTDYKQWPGSNTAPSSSSSSSSASASS